MAGQQVPEYSMHRRVHAVFALLCLALALSACGKHEPGGTNAAGPTGAAAASATPSRAADGNASVSTETGVPVAVQAGPRVDLHTSMGDIVVELYPDKAPKTVENFLSYAREGYYNGTVFHRVIDDLLIQGGAYTPDMQKKPAHPPIGNEANNGLSNQRGTISAARGRSAASATSEFFINLVDNPRFDFTSDAHEDTSGYTVFGKVISGMNVVDKIRGVKTHPQGKFTSDVPITPVVVDRVEILPPAEQ
jgi:cyclophilin family peptidyl-prolyl cis-trans isomerase